MTVALVTGASSGIGAATAIAFAEAGWDVMAAGRDEGRLEEVADVSDNIAIWTGDLAESEDCDELVADTIDEFGALDCLVNSAGILLRGAEYELDVFQKVIDVNLTGTMRMCVACHDLLADGGGAIVNTASMLSFFGGPLVPAYSASKGGVAQLTKALAGKWAEEGVRVNAVAPGWIETEMTAGLRADESREAGILGRTPMGRWGKPEEVGRMAAWLLSDDASFTTGAVMPVDGGYAAM